MDHIVVDVEIKKTIEETPGGWNSTHLLGVSTAVVYEYEADRFRVYGDSDADLDRLRQRLMAADRITTYNGWRFDFPVIWGISRDDLDVHVEVKTNAVRNGLEPNSDDLLRRIWQALHLNPDIWSRDHAGWSLDSVANETLGRKKIGNGADAPKWYQAGKWGQLVNYCIDDVALERDLSDFIDKFGYVVKDRETLHIPAWKQA